MSSRITSRGAPNSNTADSKVSVAKGGRRQARADGPLMCTNCRARKTRCDGTRPCHYGKPPPMSQILAMAARLQKVEAELAALKNGSYAPGQNGIGSEGQTSVSTSEVSFERQSSDVTSQQQRSHQLPNVGLDRHTQYNGTEVLLTEFSLDENGKVSLRYPGLIPS
ncbi:hypothetical protein ACEPPN_010081 [Leptodophora sp. 'Broadleaf-Isolate-01']